MNIAAILKEFAANGIRLEAHGEILRYAPHNAITPELLTLAKTHKQVILKALRPLPQTAEANEDWPETIDARNVTPCPECGTLALWQSMANKWRCLRCDPPIRWRTFVASQRTDEPND